MTKYLCSKSLKSHRAGKKENKRMKNDAKQTGDKLLRLFAYFLERKHQTDGETK